MAKLKFRELRADEIDCRVAMVKQNGFSLLLYKDARCDMNILDETVGPMNWQRSHSRDNANCIVSIWDDDKKMWISKEDTGTESNTEAEKGLASDSFKRACFNWGIGRELYTAPFIWVKAEDGNPKTDKFIVESITINNGRITALSIRNTKTKKVVYTVGKPSKAAPTGDIAPTGEPMYSYTTPEQAPIAPPMPVAPVAPAKPKNPIRVKFVQYCTDHEIDVTKICKTLKLNDKSTDQDFEDAISYCKNLINDLPTEV